MKALPLLSAPLLLAILTGCSIGSKYQAPDDSAAAAATFKHAPASPVEADYIADQWWTAYGDPRLNGLVATFVQRNQDLAAAAARMDQAIARLGLSRADKWPQLDVEGNYTRDRRQRLFGQNETQNTFDARAVASYEVDLWGRVRGLVDSAKAEAQAETASYDATRLALLAEVVRTYLTLRTVDAEIALLDRTVELREGGFERIQSLHEAGDADGLALAQARTELELTNAEAIGLRNLRGSLENALAVLVGVSPSGFRLDAETAAILPPLPAVPVGLPLDALRQRPDVFAAERRLQAAHERIGVAQADYLPRIQLVGTAGYASTQAEDFAEWSTRAWSIMPSVTLPIFNAGRIGANVDRARAEAEAAQADYRQTVLVAIREVEDALNANAVLARQMDAQQRAVAAAENASEISHLRYDSGLVSYLEVVDTERTHLDAQRQLTDLQRQRYAAQVELVRALGGGWGNASEHARDYVAAN
ncbi:MAG: efflux transporter outer membrane subunit [Verrucomicrobiota bacterium JB022]|nr:efflux transporter outer membrane subunit [Verrucomicrobiota bacterium JB022]